MLVSQAACEVKPFGDHTDEVSKLLVPTTVRVQDEEFSLAASKGPTDEELKTIEVEMRVGQATLSISARPVDEADIELEQEVEAMFKLTTRARSRKAKRSAVPADTQPAAAELQAQPDDSDSDWRVGSAEQEQMTAISCLLRRRHAHSQHGSCNNFFRTNILRWTTRRTALRSHDC